MQLSVIKQAALVANALLYLQNVSQQQVQRHVFSNYRNLPVKYVSSAPLQGTHFRPSWREFQAYDKLIRVDYDVLPSPFIPPAKRHLPILTSFKCMVGDSNYEVLSATRPSPPY